MDRPGGGNSGQPYMQFPIESASTPDNLQTYYQTNRNSLDFPIRGGAITELVNGSYSSMSSTIDRERIQKFFKDAPRGKTFIQKQIGLQLTNPRTQVPNSLEFVGLSIGNAVIPVTQTYNPLNTLAQIQVQGTGAHFNRQGVVPTISESPQQTYAYIAGAPQNNTPATNRLLILKATKLIGNTAFSLSRDGVADSGIDPMTVDRLGISLIKNQLFNYQGGPGSVYGIGTTRIFRTTNTEPTQEPVTGVAYSSIAFSYQQLAEQATDTGESVAHPVIQDYRLQLQRDKNRPQVASSNYSQYKIESKLNVGTPGAYEDRSAYNVTDSLKAKKAVDQLNALNPFYYDSNNENPWTKGGDSTTDMIKFAFECISNDNPGESVALVFRAFLDGAISDNNQAEFNSFKYLGRGETFRTYQGFDRSISFNFKIFTQTRSEMQPLYKKLNHLISQVYPDYSPVSNLMRGSVVRMTIGDYIYRMPGFLESVNVTIDNSNTSWEILLNEYNDDDVRQLPHVISVSCAFKPIMDILPRRQTYASPFVPLIVNGDNYLNPDPIIRPDRGTIVSVAPTDDISAPQQLTANLKTRSETTATTVPVKAKNAPVEKTKSVVKAKGVTGNLPPKLLADNRTDSTFVSKPVSTLFIKPEKP